MQSPTESHARLVGPSTSDLFNPPAAGTAPADLLNDARAREGAGCLAEALDRYQQTIEAAERTHDRSVMAEALRRLAAVHHKRGDTHRARELCERSYSVARSIPDDLLAAEALNTLGVVDMMSGALNESSGVFHRALRLGGMAGSLRARVDQNLGILANIQGRLGDARAWYQRSLDEFHRIHDEHGCAIAYHNLAMVSADADQLDEAERHLRASRRVAEKSGDLFLHALCMVNQAEVDVARQRYENAKQNAEDALALFDQLGARGAKADAYRVIGMVYRETGHMALAESRLRAAITLAAGVESVLGEAEARRELALVYQTMGQNQKALRLLHDAYQLFRGLDAHADLVYVGGKMAELETTYRAVVRAWGRSIESADSYTFGHCERVARIAVSMARVLDFDEQAETTVLLGAYLHDVGMVRVPHEILAKDGELTDEDRRLLEMHPVWGAELLSGVEFPWDIKGIIRWHHERLDGSGFPDHLSGNDVPLAAQIVGIADLYDELTSGRACAPARGQAAALDELRAHRDWWAPQVLAAIERVIAERPSQD